MNPLIADIHDIQRSIMLKDASQDDKIYKVKELIKHISEMSLKDDNCMKILENAAAQMSIEKYKKRIVTLPNLLMEKH